MKSKFWNTNSEGNKRFIHGKWINWYDGNIWNKINIDFGTDRQVTDIPFCTEVPSDSHGTMSLCFDHKWSMGRHIRKDTTKTNPENPFDLDLISESASNVSGHQDPKNLNRWIYPNAWPYTTLRYGIWHGRVPRLEKVLEIDVQSMPSAKDLSYSFLLKSPDAIAFVGKPSGPRPWSGRPGDSAQILNSEIYISKSGSGIRGATIKNPVCWWYSNSQIIIKPIMVVAEILSDGQTVRMTKKIPQKYVQAARDANSKLWSDITVSPDANPETSSVDGWMEHSTGVSTWSSKRDSLTATAYNDSNSTIDMRINSTGGDNWSNLHRGHVGFDLSGESGTADACTIDLITAVWNFGTGTPPKMFIVSHSLTSNTTLENLGDYEKSNYGLSTPHTAATAPGQALNDVTTFTFDSDGLTYLDTVIGSDVANHGVCSDADVNNVEPWSGSLNKSFHYAFRSAEDATRDPVMTLTLGTPDTTPPTAPTSLTLGSRTTTSITVTFIEGTDDVAMSHTNKYVNTIADGNEVSPATETTFTGLTEATSYNLELESEDTSGNKSSKTLITLSTVDNTAPTVPGSLSRTSRTTTTLTLSWSASTDNSGDTPTYNIYRNSVLIQGSHSLTSYTHTGLSEGTQYNFEVSAVDSQGNESAKTLLQDSTESELSSANKSISGMSGMSGQLHG